MNKICVADNLGMRVTFLYTDSELSQVVFPMLYLCSLLVILLAMLLAKYLALLLAITGVRGDEYFLLQIILFYQNLILTSQLTTVSRTNFLTNISRLG